MKTFRIAIVGGTIACATLAVTAAVAQEATAASQPAADGCSFLDCLLHGRKERPAAPQAAAAAAPAADSAAPKLATSSSGVAEPDVGVSPRTKAKPAPAVTLAADAAEKPRLKALAAARPRHALHLVAAHSDEAELTLGPTLDAASGDEALHLYSEQLLVIAGPAIKSVGELRDKQVSLGSADGSTAAIARRAFAAAGIPVREVSLDEANALDGLATGDIDAVVVLAPQPAPALAKLRAPGLHLVGWPEDVNVPAGARREVLAATSYPDLAKDATGVVAVDAVLTLTPKGARSAAARGLFASLRQHAGALARHGFDRLGGDLDARKSRRVASDERR